MVASHSIPPASLERHLRRLEAILRRRTLGHDAVLLSREYPAGGMIAGLMGVGTERIERNRGGGAFVAPMFELGADELLAWLGFRTEWRPARTGKRLLFHDLSMTIHLGYPYQQPKPQVFRMEWSSQPDDTGQPHWQFDALESVPSDHAEGSLFRDVVQSEAMEGGSRWLEPEDIATVVRGIGLSRIHFASVAAWWQGNSAFHAPKSTTEIESWVDKTLEYTKSELGRLRRS